MKTHHIDATNQSIGRLATGIVLILRGKDTPGFKPNEFPDVEVIVSNLDKVKFTGTKLKTTQHHHYSGYPGGLYTRTLGQLWSKSPKEVFRKTVYRMLPENRSRDRIIQNLKFE